MNKRGIIMIKLDKIIKIYNPKKANEYEKTEQEKIPVEENHARYPTVKW